MFFELNDCLVFGYYRYKYYELSQQKSLSSRFYVEKQIRIQNMDKYKFSSFFKIHYSKRKVERFEYMIRHRKRPGWENATSSCKRAGSLVKEHNIKKKVLYLKWCTVCQKRRISVREKSEIRYRCKYEPISYSTCL